MGVTLLLSIDYTDLLRKKLASDSPFNTLTSVYVSRACSFTFRTILQGKYANEKYANA